MADRKASVALELEAGQFKTEAATVEAKVDGVDRAVDKLDRDITKIPADAAKAGAAMKLLGGEARGVGDNIGAIGDKSTAMNLLDARILKSRDEVKKLVTEFEKTGDTEVFHNLGKASGDLAALTRLRKSLAGAVQDGGKEGASTFASAFQGGIISAFNSLPTELKIAVGEAVVVAIVGAAAPIGAAINGVLLAGIGLGGIGLGIAGQLSNLQVRDAFVKLGKDVTDSLTTATAGFAQPLIGSARILDTALTGVLGKIRPQLEGLAQLVEPLARGLAGMLTELGPGLADALGASEPILREIAAQLPKLGDSIGSFFKLIADGGKGAKDGIDLLFLAIETLVVGIGGIVDGLSHLYEGFLAPGKAILDLIGHTQHVITPLHDMTDAATAAAGATHGLGMIAFAAGENFLELSKGISQSAQTADALAAAMVSKVFTATMDVDQAVLAVAESLTRLDESFKSNGHSMDIHTKKGQANREALLGAVSANMQLYQAQVSAGVSAEDAAAAYDSNYNALVRNARQAGLTQKQIDGLIGKYKGVPHNVDTAIAMQGLTDAINGLADLIRLINHIPLSKNVTITTTYRTNGTPQQGHSRVPGERYGGIVRAAEGMLVPPSNPGTVLFGEPETGGEAYIPLKGISQSRAMGLAQTVGNSYGFQVSTPQRSPSQAVAAAQQSPTLTQYEQVFAWVIRRLQAQGAI